MNRSRLKIGFLGEKDERVLRRGQLVACVVYSSHVCPKCEILKRYLVENDVQHLIRMIEEPEVKVDALMLNIYSTPALVLSEHVLHQTDLFRDGHLDKNTLQDFLRRYGHGEK